MVISNINSAFNICGTDLLFYCSIRFCSSHLRF